MPNLANTRWDVRRVVCLARVEGGVTALPLANVAMTNITDWEDFERCRAGGSGGMRHAAQNRTRWFDCELAVSLLLVLGPAEGGDQAGYPVTAVDSLALLCSGQTAFGTAV